METFISFLNNLGIYNKLLSLQKIIEDYIIMCSTNKEDIRVYNRLHKSLKLYQDEYQKIIQPLSKTHLKERILSEWKWIAPMLIKNPKLIEERDSSCKLPIYALVQTIVKEELDFYEIYAFIIEHKLYNPNINIGISDEPFFAMIPKENLDIFCSLNEVVLKDERTDYHILQNGSDFFEYSLYHYKAKAKDQKYWKKHLLWCLQSNLSVLDSKRYKSLAKKNGFDFCPIIYEIFNEKNNLDFLVSFLLTEKSIYIQCKNSIYPSIERNKAIDFYCEKLEEIGMENILLKSLKCKGDLL